MSWHQGTLLAFDTETTGTDPETARIVTASVVVIDPMAGSITKEDWLADPGVEIPDGAASVHGISTEHARQNGRPAVEVVTELTRTLADALESGVPLVAYNGSYDLTVLDRECRRHDVPTLEDRCADDGLDLIVIDPLVIDKHVDKWRKGSRKLVDVSRHYGVVLSDEDAHTAYGDSLATARVAWMIAKKYPAIADLTLPELHASQAGWYAAQAASFETYLRKQGKNDVISREWPIRKAVA